jgi:hypothetical protein
MQCVVAHFKGRSRVTNYSTQQPLEQRRPSMPTVTQGRSCRFPRPAPTTRPRSIAFACQFRSHCRCQRPVSQRRQGVPRQRVPHEGCERLQLQRAPPVHLRPPLLRLMRPGWSARANQEQIEARAAERKLQEREGTEAYRGVVACCHDKTQVHVLLVQQ